MPNIIKQLIIYKVSDHRQGHYCAAAHKVFANMMGKSLNEDTLFLIADDMEPHVRIQ